MTNMTHRNTPENVNGERVELALPALPAEDETRGSGGTSRREALAALARHAAYTAPAVMTILSLTTNRAKAGYF
jgi:hypothetical protein